MNKLLLLVLIFVLTGCAGNLQYGDFTPAEPVAIDFIAEDAANQVAEIYPAAHTIFKMNPQNLGILGATLETNLRDLGFAVSYTEGVDFNYIFDALPQNRFRLTLDLEDSKISRLYSNNSTALETKIEAVTKWTVFNKE